MAKPRKRWIAEPQAWEIQGRMSPGGRHAPLIPPRITGRACLGCPDCHLWSRRGHVQT